MALSSMTGFARSHGASGPYTFEWELKSVNAKGFDLRVRLPQGFDELEAHAKKRAGELLSRGTVYANLTVKRASAAASVRVNEDVLNAVLKAAAVIAGKVDAVAIPRPVAIAFAGQVPGSQIAEDRYAVALHAIAVPKGQGAQLNDINEFLVSAKTSGFVQQAMERVGLRGAEVAPD